MVYGVCHACGYVNIVSERQTICMQMSSRRVNARPKSRQDCHMLDKPVATFHMQWISCTYAQCKVIHWIEPAEARVTF